MKGKRIDLKTIRKLVGNKDGVLLDNFMSKGYYYVTIRCNKDNNIWTTTLNNIQRGTWCKICGRKKAGEKTKIDPEKIKKLVENKDGVLLNDTMIKGTRYITIQCNKDNNVWTARLNAIRCKGHWCRECYKRSKIKKVDIKDINKLLDNKGFELLTTTHIDFWTKIKIRCPKHNREWETSYGTLARGDSNCKLCAHGTVAFDVLNKIITDNNATYIKRIPGKCMVRNIVLKCNIHDHIWTTNAGAIIIVDRWCVYCKREARKTSYEKIKEMVESKGGTLLTEGCNGSLTKINVRCKNNHEWITYFDNINQGYWCPKCPYKTQSLLHDIIKELFPGLKTHYNYHGFKWLKSNKKLDQRMEVDIWVPDIKLAIEYDGEQHFMPIKFSSSITDEQMKKDFSALKRRDRKKDKLIAAHKDQVRHFIRFNYKDKIYRENVESVLKKYGVIE